MSKSKKKSKKPLYHKYPFEGFSFHELGSALGVYYPEHDSDDEDLMVYINTSDQRERRYLDEIQRVLSVSWWDSRNNAKHAKRVNKTVIAFLTKLVSESGHCYDTPVWQAMIDLEDDETRLKYVGLTLPMLWT